jgi:hypothetical protein
MKRNPLVLSAFGLALILGASAPGQRARAQEIQVVAQDLRNLRVPGKISAALWTRRQEFFTLQIVFERFPQRPLQVAQPGVVAAPPANAEIWLQRVDGTHISPMRSWETPAAQKNCLRCIAYDVEYFFPLSVSDDAVAVAMKLGDVVYIEKLKPFAEKL